MASRRRQRSTTKDSMVNSMVQDVAQCYELFELVAQQIRLASQLERDEGYRAAELEWQEPDKPNIFPMNNKDLQPQYFDKCRAILQSNPMTTKDRYLVGFACHAMRAGISMVLCTTPHWNPVMNEARQIAMQRLAIADANTPKSSDHLPEYIKEVLFQADGAPDPLEKPGPFLVGKSFQYRDTLTRRTETCHVHDCGTSHLMGDWFEVSCGGSEDVSRITKNEMTEYFEARETDPKEEQE